MVRVELLAVMRSWHVNILLMKALSMKRADVTIDLFAAGRSQFILMDQFLLLETTIGVPDGFIGCVDLVLNLLLHGMSWLGMCLRVVISLCLSHRHKVAGK